MPVELRLTHLDWSPEAALIHFQGQRRSICELDYHILQTEIQNVPKTKGEVEIGEFCLAEDLTPPCWCRGRLQSRKGDLFDVFLIDHGHLITVDVDHISSCSNNLFVIPPKVVYGFLANVLILHNWSDSVTKRYLSSLIGRSVTGFLQALLPHEVLLLEVPDINSDLVRNRFARHVDRTTFFLLAGMLTEVPFIQYTEQTHILPNPKLREQELKSCSWERCKAILLSCGLRLSCGTCVKVKVAAALNTSLFFCQLASRASDLKQISKDLTVICESKNPFFWEKLDPLCAVKGKDEQWYRGLVQFLPVNSKAKVFFLDYGFVEYVKFENILKLPTQFYSIPIMVFPCSISGLTEDLGFKTHQLALFKAGLLGRNLNVRIRDFDEDDHLHIINILGVENAHVEEVKSNQNVDVNVTKFLETKALPQTDGFAYYELVLGEASRKTLEAEEMEVGSVIVGYVVYAQNPNHFWIRTQKRNVEYEEMMAQMMQHFSQVDLEEDALLNPDVGEMCCAMYEQDLQFYRGVVTDLLEHGAEIFFVDFGNIEKVPHMLIKNIPEKFSSPPPFVLRCTLDVLPLDDIWTSCACQFFRRAVSNKALLVHIIQMRNDKLSVDLIDVEGERSITELLISSRLAEYWLINNTNRTEKNAYLHCIETIKESDKSKQQQDELEIRSLCKNKSNRPENQTSYKELSIKPGFEFLVCCSHMNSPFDFWCQAERSFGSLQKVMDDIQQYYSVHTVRLQPRESCCVVKSPLDDKWYRGLILGKQNNKNSVFLVDYGAIIHVQDHRLQAIMPEFLCLEGQAFWCSFHGLIESAEDYGSWSPQVNDLLKEFVKDSTCTLKCKVLSQVNVQSNGLCNVIYLYNTKTQKSLTDTLLNQGLARRVTMASMQIEGIFPKTFVYSSFDLNPGDEEEVYVTHVGNQNEIYFQLERNAELIDKIQRKIFEESEKMMELASNADENMCLAKHLDGVWYRAMALPVGLPRYFSVFFVDYGNSSISEKDEVRLIPRDCADLLYTPMQAVRCNLYLVPKHDEIMDAQEWLKNAILNKALRAIIQGKREDGSFDIELFDGDININEKVKNLFLSQTHQTKSTFGTTEGGTKHDTSPFRSKVFADCTSLTDAPKERPVMVDSFCQTESQWQVRVEFPDTEINSRRTNIIVTKSEEFLLTEFKEIMGKNVQKKSGKNRKSEGRVFAVEDESSLVELKPAGQLAKQTAKTGRHFKGKRSRTRSRSNPKKATVKALGKCANEFPHVVIQAKDIKFVTVLSVMSDGSFYVRLSKNNNLLILLEKYIADNINKYKRVAEHEIKAGLKCLVQVEENMWQRAVVQDLSDGKSKFFLGDHGVTKDIQSGSVSQQCMNLQKVPNLAFLCKIYSEKEEDHRQHWCETLKLFTGKEIKLMFLSRSGPRNMWTVEIFMSGLFVHQIQTVLKRQEKGAAQIQSERSTGTPLSDKDATQQLFFAPLLKNTAYSSFAASVSTPSEFSVIPEDLHFIMSRVSSMLHNLSGTMDSLPMAHLLPGSCCLFKSESKNKWCRAEIMDVSPTVVLHLVDYNHYECIKYHEVYKLKKLEVELAKLPKVAYPCTLSGVKPVAEDGKWTSEAAVFFQQRLQQKNLQVFFKEFTARCVWSVDALSEGIHITQDLVDAGHATYVDVLLGHRCQAAVNLHHKLLSAMKSSLRKKKQQQQIKKLMSTDEVSDTIAASS